MQSSTELRRKDVRVKRFRTEALMRMLCCKYAGLSRLTRLTALLTLELCILNWAYSSQSAHCIEALSHTVCLIPSRMGLRATAFLAVFGLIILARSDMRSLLAFDDRDERVVSNWISIQLVGFCFIPLPKALGFRSDGLINPSLGAFIVGGFLTLLGTAFMVAGCERWRSILVALGPVPVALLAASLFLFSPEIKSANFMWQFQPLTQATFQTVVFMLKSLGVEATAKPLEHELSSASFSIVIESACSGVEGLGLMTLFVLTYFYLFKERLRYPNVWVLLPIGLVSSWVLNAARIAMLFLIGRNGNPELATNGFHSHAGWLMFTILSLSMIGVSTAVPWFRHDSVTAQTLFNDWRAACLLPFAAFMGAALLLSTFTVIPDLWYFAKAIAICSVMVAFLPLYRARLNWRIHHLVISAGIAIGLLWIAFGRKDQSEALAFDQALASLPISLWVGWVLARLIGTIVLVPVAEELLFRGYLLDRFAHKSGAIKAAGLLLSTGLFAVMHERWALAAFAGLVYGLLYLRSNRVTDAIAAHSASNTVIGLYALATAKWALI